MLFQTDVEVVYKIQGAQFLLRNFVQQHRVRAVINELRRLAMNTANMTHKQIADLADLLLHCGDEVGIDMGRGLIRHLQVVEAPRVGRNRRQPRTIYDDSQNVHDSQINNAVKNALKTLAKDTVRPDDPPKTKTLLLDSAIDTIDHIKTTLEDRKICDNSISLSLGRITTDYAYFTKEHRFRLRDILQRVWNRIINHMDEETREEAIKRLVDELKDMSGKCSTGHMSRIVNVLSGFPLDKGGLKVVKISWTAQIQANIKGRVNARMRDIEDEDKKGDVVNGMIESGDERAPYTNFVMEVKQDIFEELLQEFIPLFEKVPEDMEEIDEKLFIAIFEKSYATML
jgi:hypothetical protein